MTTATRAFACALLVATAAPRAVHAQSALGRVLESETHHRLGGVQVTLVDSAGRVAARMTTDSTGAFYLDAPAPGRYALNFEWSGTTLTTPARALAAGEEVQAEYFLVPPPPASALAGTTPERAYSEYMVAKPVKPVRTPAPRYPDAARAAGKESKLLIQYVVDTTGRVRMNTVRIIRSGGDEFDRAVRDVLPLMRFEPARLANGRRVPQVVRQPFAFSLAAAPPCAPSSAPGPIPRCLP